MESQQSNQAFTQEYLNKLHEVVAREFGPRQADATLAVLEENSSMYLRMLAVVGAYRQGKTLEETGVLLDLTRERVRQILVKARSLDILDVREGGVTYRTKTLEQQRHKNKIEMEEKRIRRFFGCGRDEFYRLNEGYSPWAGKGYRCPSRRSMAYIHQKRAAVRAAEWNLTFPEWWSVWEKSGNWAFHGRGRGKMTLARLDNNKPFELNNVAIMLNENVSSMAGTKAHRLWPDIGRYRRSSPDLTEKQEIALRMREEGKTLKEISKALGIGESTASGYATSARRRREIREKQSAVGIGTMLKKMLNR